MSFSKCFSQFNFLAVIITIFALLSSGLWFGGDDDNDDNNFGSDNDDDNDNWGFDWDD